MPQLPPGTHLVTERLIIRDWTSEDAADAFAMYGDPEVTATLPDHMHDADIDATRAWLAGKVEQQARQTDGLGSWAVEERATGRVIGGALLQYTPINGRQQVEVGYHFARAAWGQGYATEVARALLTYGFEQLHLPRITGVIVPGNTASRRVLTKVGMRSEDMGDYDGFPVEVFAIERTSD